jgi:hypothetical protein
VEVERLAEVFVRKDDFLVDPNVRTVTGLWLIADPVVQLPRAASTAELGAAVRSALAASRQDIPHPHDRREFPSSLLRVAGVRSWNALQRSAARCQVETNATAIRVLPSRNGGTRGDDRGYHSLEELAVTLPAAGSDEELGAAVMSVVARCQ